ncbi:Aspartyl/asparaginyl beta-hydroxylase [Pseudolycoriella hygida]|uniref:Aspartyl/asparaginyl beta-hydroxylase n=1 Tax=Pseudolycoriella hygida TaxID=35572 RepID=A0A9Q0S4D2_9DIPT|nr:Aspartyl/asparaginyl beta-hydroxylase [Pseudolycoriella hygida]
MTFILVGSALILVHPNHTERTEPKMSKAWITMQDDDASNGKFIDVDSGEDLHLQKFTEKEATYHADVEAQQEDTSSHEEEPKEKSLSGVHTTKMGPDDIQFHVHSDHGTGGHWCAKILFFSLMTVLLGLIGLILLENRGLSDLDTPLSESRFANYLEGWVDEEREIHNDIEILESIDELDEHDLNQPFEEENNDNTDNDEIDDQSDEGHEEDNEDTNDNHDEEEEGGDDDELKDIKKEENEPSNEDEEENMENDTEDDDDTLRYQENDNSTENEGALEDEDSENEGRYPSDFAENEDNDEGFEDQLSDDYNQPFEEHANKNTRFNPSKNAAYVSAEDLKIQVDEVYGHFNKLAESLNITKMVVDVDVNRVGNKHQKGEDDDASNEKLIDNDSGEDLHLQKLTEATYQADVEAQQEDTSSHDERTEFLRSESVDLKRRFTLITSAEPIPSDVDDEQPNEEEDGILRGSETNVVDTFTEMKNMYRPKIDTQIAMRDEKVKVKLPLEATDNTEEQLDEYEEDEDIEDVDDEEEVDEEPSDVDDDDLMKRLESKYGKLPERNSSDEGEIEDKWTKVKRSGPQEDDDFDDELRRTNEMLYDLFCTVVPLTLLLRGISGVGRAHFLTNADIMGLHMIFLQESLLTTNSQNPTSALKSFELLIEIRANSSKAWYGKGKALDKLSEAQKSNEILKEAIAAYVKAIEFGSSLDDAIFKVYAVQCIERMRFIGQHLNAVPVHKALIERFNDDPYYRNQLAVTYLLANRLADAKLVLHETLLRWRRDGFALAHYGFVLKNLDKNYEAATVFLQEGIDSEAEGTNDGRFYFSLGEAMTRLGRNKEAMEVYRKGASKKLFLSEYQRSLYNVDRLKSRPFWTKKETNYVRYLDVLEQNWERIRDEGLSVLNDEGHFTDESENLRDIGDWKQFDLFTRGRKINKHCEKVPFTCKIIETFPAARFCKRGQVKFSVMHPGTHVWPHCGPTNCRIRVHLGLKVPEKTSIRVANKTRSWKEGKLLIFDDSFEHEVWHNGTTVRLVLIVDVWHPDLTELERTNLYPI